MRVSRAARGGRAGAAAGLTLGLLALGGTAPSYAVDQGCENIATDQADVVTTERTGSPVQLMQVARAQQVAAEGGRVPGAGVTVAVLDSGVADSDLMDVVRPAGQAARELVDPQGTSMAGLIAAQGTPEEPIGVAPGARILDVRVYDRRDPDDTSAEVGPRADLLLEGLRYVAGLPRGDVGVLVMGLSFARTPELDADLRAVLADLAAKDVLVVAASGDRPTEESDALYPELGYDGEEPPHGEDARPVIWPAANPGVLAVNATGTALVEDEVVVGDADGEVLRSSATDLAAPTLDAVSVGIDGRSTCLLSDISTAWAAAEVAGVAALVRSAFPQESARQVVARLESTATGSLRASTVLTGHGVVQPVEALTRPLRPTEEGDVGGTRVVDEGDQRAEAPQPEADVLASTKRNAVWWGLLAGGALVVAVLLRPVLARRRD